MINLIQTTKLSFKKVKFNKGKTLFVIVPISLLFMLLVIASSEITNIINVAEKSIFSSIQSQNEVIELNKNSTSFGGSRTISFDSSSTDSSYTAADTTAIDSVNNVEKSSLITTVPIKNITSSDTIDGSTISTTSLAGLDGEYAKIYSNEDFTYKEGDVIPIILNANDLQESYQDWQGKDEIDVDLSALRNAGPPKEGTNPLQAQNPNKTKALVYNKADLIGKEFTMSFGGLDDIQNYTQESTSTGFKYVKKTQDTINTETATRKTDISKYWDYAKISKPITYKFKVVGIVEGSDKTKSYVPTAFATKVLKDYLSNELSARNATAIATTDLNSQYKGLVYDGVSLKDDATNGLFAGFRRQLNQQQRNFNSDNQGRTFVRGEGAPQANFSVNFADATKGYNIPGLVVTTDRTTNEVTGEKKDFDLKKELPLESTTILIKVNSTDNLTQVVTDLNAKGYTYRDNSKSEEFKRLQNSLYTGLNIASIAFMVIAALFILLNMSKFVSESRKEIGIFRAIGAKRMDIRAIFISQSFIYIIISMITGALLGVGAILAFSGPILNSAQSFINSTVGGILTLTGSVSQSDFMNIEYKSILIYAGVLLIVTLIASLWPSEQASRVSPVEAIRN
ncbi:MAG: FtsX-like permease family protein [Candidatus Dojkabacteria bacterium]